jgi:hypothetical protein
VVFKNIRYLSIYPFFRASAVSVTCKDSDSIAKLSVRLLSSILAVVERTLQSVNFSLSAEIILILARSIQMEMLLFLNVNCDCDLGLVNKKVYSFF